ncbi:hypothetical protein H310_06110 [Aphanomyces invadans]|uniref:USP domain-containing protein n=1 Tax=Aphanomyces invadans TaxID=157072 RepID=A0A024U878_9STRA|nr:hypothetical protein H310_06110 [Aphanomyces invadans]ETW02651.1 hypothetical protein H310_06110 [Aphanomyces invadans]|eukprot:XP_008869256.1 hypothetical protein H310_06110 [Aphanomyces invadans]
MGELHARYKYRVDRMTYACPGEDDDKTRGQQSRPLLEKRVRSYMSFTPSSDLFRRVRADLNNVQILKLGGFDLGDRGAWVLGKALASNESLGLLDLGFNGITSKGIEQIAEALEEGKNRTLKTLYLSGNGVGVGGAARLAGALRSNKSLKTLYLSGNGIGDEGLKHLADMLRVNTSLTALYLGTNSIGSGGMAHLADALTVNEHVEELMLSQNRIESAGVLSLVEAFATANLPLQTLEIGFNGIDAAGVTALADVLDSRPNQLQNLYLDNNPVGDAGAAALGRCLAKKAKSHSSLRVLDLSYAQLSLLGFRDLCMGLRDSTTLMGLLLDGHDWASTKYMERPPPNVASLAKDDAYQYAAKCVVTALQMNPSLPLVKLTGVNLSFAPGLNVDLPEGKEAMQPVCALNERIMNHVRRVAMGNQTNATAPPPSSELACGDRYQEMIHQSRKVLEKIAALPFDADELNALCAYYCADLLKPQQQQQNKGDDPLHPAKRRRLSVDHSNEAINDQNDHPSPRISPPCRVAVYPKVEHRLRLLARREDEIERHCGVLTVLRQLHYLVKSLNSMENASALIETVLGTDEGGSTGSSAIHLPQIPAFGNMSAAATTATAPNEVLSHGLPAVEIFSGWMQIKTQSYVNVRPRHVRYSVLAVHPLKPTSIMMYTFKFQPSTDELAAALADCSTKTAYSDLKFVPWDKRDRGFLLHALDKEDRPCVLEVEVKTTDLYDAWANNLTSESTWRNVATAALQKLPKAKTEMWRKGASIHRGLQNDTGENNCFLNVIIQSFWHLVPLRRLLLDVTIKESADEKNDDGSETAATNVLKTLKATMMAYEDPSSGSLHPKELRQGLSLLYKTDKLFAEGSMADAEETLLTILNLMHQQSDMIELTEAERATLKRTRTITSKSVEGYVEKPLAVFDPNSIPHIVFSHQIYDRHVCQNCRHSSPWELCSNLVFSTYATAALSLRQSNMESMLKHLPDAINGDLGTCHDEACNGKLATERVIHRFPPVFAMSLLWSSNSPPKEDIQTLLSTISDTLDLSEAFSVDGEAAKMAQVLHGIRAQYRFKGFVCYYGKHYFAFFFSTAHQLWLLFDDNKVTDIGKWTDVVEHCVKGRYQPVLLFYEVPDARKDSSIGLFRGETVMAVPEQKPAPTPGTSQILASLKLSGSSSAKSAIIEPSDARVAPAAVVTLQNANGSLSQLPTAGASKLWQNITAVNEAIAMPPRTNIMLKPLQPLEYDVEFPVDAVVLGLYLEKLDDDLCVTAFPRTPHGDKLEAEASGVIGLFDTVVMANGHPLGHYTVDRALKMIQAQKRPLRIRFKKSQRVQTLLDMGFSLDRALEGLRVGRGSVDVAAEHCSTSQT